jgi:hypothetical protein
MVTTVFTVIYIIKRPDSLLKFYEIFDSLQHLYFFFSWHMVWNVFFPPVFVTSYLEINDQVIFLSQFCNYFSE